MRQLYIILCALAVLLLAGLYQYSRNLQQKLVLSQNTQQTLAQQLAQEKTQKAQLEASYQAQLKYLSALQDKQLQIERSKQSRLRTLESESHATPEATTWSNTTVPAAIASVLNSYPTDSAQNLPTDLTVCPDRASDQNQSGFSCRPA